MLGQVTDHVLRGTDDSIDHRFVWHDGKERAIPQLLACEEITSRKHEGQVIPHHATDTPQTGALENGRTGNPNFVPCFPNAPTLFQIIQYKHRQCSV